MKGNNKLFPLVVLLFILASLSINGQTTSATESNVVNLQVGTSAHNLEGHEINTSNAFLSTLTITTNNQSFSDELYGGVYEQIILAGSETAPLAIVTKRLDGTARVLTFDVLALKENGWTKVHSSNDYLKGSLTVENNVLTVKHAKYTESDANYDPTYVLEDQFSIEDSKVTLLDTTTSNLKSSSFQSVTTTSDSEFTGLNRVQQLALTVTGKNPTPQELNAILTKKAYEHNIPPEVLKTIAYLESSWQQYNNDGHPRISTLDGQGVGLMQVTDGTLTMSEDKLLRLMTDIEYNIDEGIRILEAKYGYIKAGILPTINEQDRTILEHWYWPIAAYNGISSINNPLTNPGKTYQEKFFKKLEEFSHISVTPFPSNVLQGVIYVDSRGILRFNQKNLTISGPFHKTAHDLEKNSIVTVSATSVSLRSTPDLKADKSNVVTYLSKGEAVKIVGAIQNDPSKLVHFPWYPVELPSQPGKTYYVAGSYLNNINLFDYREDLSGDTRYSTSSIIADYGWNSTTDTVVLARGDISVDGLAGSVLADMYNAPLLLTEKNSIPSSVLSTIKRLKPSKIYVLGGESAISSTNLKTLTTALPNLTIKRVSGAGRYETAVNIAKEINDVQTVFIASGNELSPDALSIGPAAAKQQAPILLSSEIGLTSSTLSYLKDKTSVKVYVIGGTSVVPANVEQQLKDIGIKQIERIGGSDRYETSIKIAKKFFPAPDHILFANSITFIDALPGSPLAAKLNGPIILTKQDEVVPVLNNWLSTEFNKVPTTLFLGGPSAISEKTRVELQSTIISNL